MAFSRWLQRGPHPTMSETQPFHRGDVILVDLPFVTDRAQAKVRPAVIIQNDTGNRHSANLIVASITTRVPRRTYPTNLVIQAGTPSATAAGLERTSALQGEVLFTVPKSDVVRRLGRLSPSILHAFDKCLKVSLGLT